jgi:hypothetical protein
VVVGTKRTSTGSLLQHVGMNKATLRDMMKIKTILFWHISQNCHDSLKGSESQSIPAYFLRSFEVLIWEENITSRNIN